MTHPFAIVCDSCADLTLPWYEANDVTVVPFKLRFNQSVLDDVLELTPADATNLLALGTPISVLAPSVADFRVCFQRLAEEGSTRIVCVCASSAFTNTCTTARLAAQGLDPELRVEVEVLDTGVVSVGEGMVVCDLVRTRIAGLAYEEALGHARELAEHLSMLMVSSPKNAFSLTPTFTPTQRIRARFDKPLGLWSLWAFDGEGAPNMVASTKDPAQLAALVANLVTVDCEREGFMVHAGYLVGISDAALALKDTVVQRLTEGRSLGTVEASGVVAYRAGLGGFGLVYVPERYLYLGDDLPKLVFESVI